MRLSVVHDADGRILSLAMSPPAAPLATLSAASAQVSAIDAPELGLQAGDAKIAERLIEIAQTHRVERGDRPGASARLIKRSGS